MGGCVCGIKPKTSNSGVQTEAFKPEDNPHLEQSIKPQVLISEQDINMAAASQQEPSNNQDSRLRQLQSEKTGEEAFVRDANPAGIEVDTFRRRVEYQQQNKLTKAKEISEVENYKRELNLPVDNEKRSVVKSYIKLGPVSWLQGSMTPVQYEAIDPKTSQNSLPIVHQRLISIADSHNEASKEKIVQQPSERQQVQMQNDRGKLGEGNQELINPENTPSTFQRMVSAQPRYGGLKFSGLENSNLKSNIHGSKVRVEQTQSKVSWNEPSFIQPKGQPPSAIKSKLDESFAIRQPSQRAQLEDIVNDENKSALKCINLPSHIGLQR